MKHIVTFVSAAAILVLNFQHEALAGAYLNSAHGNSTYGVKRTATSAKGYARGNCAHCHGQHAPIEGSDSAQASGTLSGKLLFYDNYITQTDGFCFKCHTDSGSVQATGGVVNRSYSYRAGRWTSDPLNNVKSAFSYTTSTSYPSASSHNLADIKMFVSNSSRSDWKYRSDSNPCSACHNPHSAQGDPANAGIGASPKTGAGGWMLSLPSQHGSLPMNLWGDSIDEKMFNYTGSYQAPYRFGGISNGYEPDGSMTANGSNLTDFNTFCTDCHNSTNKIDSTLLGGPLKTIDWLNADRHGQPSGSTPSAQLIAPYNSKTSYVLACTDCHEPHGSPNIFLTRQEVNNGLVVVNGAAQNGGGSQWASLCERCHGNTAAIGSSHHAIMGATPCVTCHDSASPPLVYVSCTNCHFHGSTTTLNGITYRTF